MIQVPFKLERAVVSVCNQVNGSRAEPKSNVVVHLLKETKKKMILMVIGPSPKENGSMTIAKTSNFKNNSSSVLHKTEEIYLLKTM